MADDLDYDPMAEMYDSRPLHEIAEEKADREKLDREATERERMEWWAMLLSTELGRREVYGWLTDGGAFRIGNQHFGVTAIGMPHDVATVYHLGARDFADKWHKWLMVNFTELAVMMWIENDSAYAALRNL